MKKNLTLICAAACVLAACTKTTAPEAPESGLQPFTLSASSEIGARTYAGASVNNSVATVIWTSDDELSVFDSAGNNNEFAMDPDGKGKAAADFTGSIAAGSTAQYAMFPYDKDASIDGDIITATVKTFQGHSNATSFGKSANLAIGSIAGSSVELKNACGLIRFVVPNMHVKSVKISCKAGQTIAGKAKFDCSTGEPILKEVVDGSNTVTFYGSKSIYASSFFICALPGTYTGITVTITKDDNSEVVMGDPESTAPLVVERAKVTDLGILSAVADKIIELDFSSNDVFDEALPTSSHSTIDTVAYHKGGYEYKLAVTKTGGFYYWSNGLLLQKAGMTFLDVPAISGMHLCAFGISHNNKGDATKNIRVYTPASVPLGGAKTPIDYVVPKQGVGPGMMYHTTGAGLSSSKKLPDAYVRFTSGQTTSNILIYKLVLYYAKDSYE